MIDFFKKLFPMKRFVIKKEEIYTFSYLFCVNDETSVLIYQILLRIILECDPAFRHWKDSLNGASGIRAVYSSLCHFLDLPNFFRVSVLMVDILIFHCLIAVQITAFSHILYTQLAV